MFVIPNYKWTFLNNPRKVYHFLISLFLVNNRLSYRCWSLSSERIWNFQNKHFDHVILQGRNRVFVVNVDRAEIALDSGGAWSGETLTVQWAGNIVLRLWPCIFWRSTLFLVWGIDSPLSLVGRQRPHIACLFCFLWVFSFFHNFLAVLPFCSSFLILSFFQIRLFWVFTIATTPTVSFIFLKTSLFLRVLVVFVPEKDGYKVNIEIWDFKETITQGNISLSWARGYLS